MSEPRVVLGMQGVQMPANALRGIGRWCSEYLLALADLSRDTIAAVSIDGQLPLPAVVSQVLSAGIPIIDTTERPEGLAEGNVVFHALSPLEDLPIERVWPKWAREPSVRLVATIFDMIPLLFPDDYFQGSLRRLLQVRYELYRQADATIGISRSTIEDAIRLLGLDSDRAFAASGAVAPRFVPHSGGRDAAASEVSALGIRPDFLLTIGNVDPRKNVTALLEAYAKLPEALRRRHQMVVTCSQADESHLAFLRANTERLRIADHVVTLSHVPDETLVRLYQGCALMVYPSLYEGLGLPIIEAQACGAATLVSDIGPMREIVAEPAARFDPTTPGAIGERLEFALTNHAFQDQLRAEGVKSAARYTWDRSVNTAMEAYGRALR